MRGKIFKTAMFALLALTLATTFATIPAFGQVQAVLQAPVVVGPGYSPGSNFYIDITIWDVIAMFGYDFRLSYDTNVLTATGFTSYAPFTLAWPSTINDIEGYVDMAYSYPMPEYFGLDVYPSDPPFPVARIDFTVDNWGVSALDLQNVHIANVWGGEYSIGVDGVFSNIWPADAVPSDVYVGLNTGFLERRHFKLSKDPDGFQTLTAQLENKGTLTTKAKARFRVVDSMGGLVAQMYTSEVYIDPGAKARQSKDLDVTTLDPGLYVVEVQVFYVGFQGWALGRHGAADAAKSTFVMDFKLEA